MFLEFAVVDAYGLCGQAVLCTISYREQTPFEIHRDDHLLLFFPSDCGAAKLACRNTAPLDHQCAACRHGHCQVLISTSLNESCK